MAVIPPSLKLITSALRRAEELDKDPNHESQVVAYYCRFYVVSKGTSLCSSPPSAAESSFLISQMDLLEKAKPGLDLSQEKGKSVCLGFAENVFNKADEVDRLGMADKATAKMFYSAGTFFDILEQFGELDPEIGDKKKYAKWKATEIINAIKMGVDPTPGGYGEDAGAGEAAAGIPGAEDASHGNEGGSGHGSAHNSIGSTHSAGSGIPSPYDIPSPPAQPPSATMATHIPNAPYNSNSPPPDYSANYAAVPATTTFAPTATTTAAATAATDGRQMQAPPQFPPRPAATVTTPAQAAQLYQQYPPPSFTHPPLSQTDPRVKDSVELCQFAIAAMNKNNLAVAKERLAEALRRLE